MSFVEQMDELSAFVSGNMRLNAEKADKGNKAASIRLRKGLLNLSRRAMVIRLDAYNAAYGKAPKSKGGVKDAGKN